MKTDNNGASKKKCIESQLLDLIQTNKLSQGDKLPSERELASIFNVSRNILREAIVALSIAGIIEVRERQGIFVKSQHEYSDMDTLKNLQLLPADFVSYQLEARTIISIPAIKLAAQRKNDEDMRKIHECYTNFLLCPYETPEEQAQSGKWEALLHHLYTEAAHNPILSRINENINALVERNNILMHPILLHESGWIEHIWQQHKTMIKAIEEGDPDLAGEILKTHMIESVQAITAKHPDLITKLVSPYWSMK